MKQLPIGMALWLLQGSELADCVEWVIRHGFAGVSLYQSFADLPDGERGAAAQRIREAGLIVNYHANIPGFAGAGTEISWGRVEALLADVAWWHENAGGMRAFCIDPIHTADAGGSRRFDVELNGCVMRLAQERLGGLGVRVGVENSFGEPGSYQFPEQMRDFRQACGVPGLGLLLDAGHANIHVARYAGGSGAIGDYVRQLPLEILDVHVTDNLGLRDEHRHVGYGSLDVPALLAALAERGYAGPLTVEVCVDIIEGRYAADISRDEQVAPILATRAALLDAMVRRAPAACRVLT